jgi:PadR family transcriptional regulator, regulatory protein PadR
MEKVEVEKAKREMRKGLLEFTVLLIISKGKVYASEIIEKLKEVDLIVVEGTLYPLLSRLKTDTLLKYSWEESPTGPPRKYYELTESGQDYLKLLRGSWESLNNSLKSLTE